LPMLVKGAQRFEIVRHPALLKTAVGVSLPVKMKRLRHCGSFHLKRSRPRERRTNDAENVEIKMCAGGSHPFTIDERDPDVGRTEGNRIFLFERAQQATLPLRRGAWEAFMANCIANLTPTPTKRRNYRKY
jgi:hypothetical protein